MDHPSFVWTARGTVSVNAGGKRQTVYVAGPAADRWAFWNGHVFRSNGGEAGAPGRSDIGRGAAARKLAAPMPATVTKVLVAPGDIVESGDTVVILEAMKMELPIRALGHGHVKAVNCRAGDLVQPDQVLVELE